MSVPKWNKETREKLLRAIREANLDSTKIKRLGPIDRARLRAQVPLEKEKRVKVIFSTKL